MSNETQGKIAACEAQKMALAALLKIGNTFERTAAAEALAARERELVKLESEDTGQSILELAATGTDGGRQ